MLLIADSGSTKTTWSLADKDTQVQTCSTSGINPLYQDEENILQLLQKEFTLSVPDDTSLYFYGAGCISASVNKTVQGALTRFFNIHSLQVDTDLLAAARALCQDHEGIACILGTGSNSCYYDGRRIVRHVSPLGYMLGDEGSGAVIGRKFIADLLKNQLPANITGKFHAESGYTSADIMEQVYKKPFPNRFLARFTHFILGNIQEEALRNIVKSSFDEFFIRNIRQYPEAKDLPVNFTGSIALHFKSLLCESAEDTGFRIGAIEGSPMEGLLKFHCLHER
jgi:N-acetylglucosamine kinase-like BadF-type ATPase